jgi:hypothetical protein
MPYRGLTGWLYYCKHNGIKLMMQVYSICSIIDSYVDFLTRTKDV